MRVQVQPLLVLLLFALLLVQCAGDSNSDSLNATLPADGESWMFFTYST